MTVQIKYEGYSQLIVAITKTSYVMISVL